MNEFLNIYLSIVTENQRQKIKAENLSKLLQSELGEDWEISAVDKYEKFEHSYKIELKITCLENHQDKINLMAIRLTDRLLSP
jgi:uncharacterized protein YktB (UPF0637 family)